jgi:hypothetical protein
MTGPVDLGRDATFGPARKRRAVNTVGRSRTGGIAMSATMQFSPQAERNRAVLAAEQTRAAATRDAEVEYSETVAKLRWTFESDLAEAQKHRRARVLPAHRAYNAAMAAAERAYAAAVANT